MRLKLLWGVKLFLLVFLLLASSFTSLKAQYCSLGATDEDEYISEVVLEDISNTSGWEGYSDFTTKSTQLLLGQTYPITVQVDSWYSDDKVWVWIDWNQDEIFDAAELTKLAINSRARGIYKANIEVPIIATMGETRMRVVLRYSSDPISCGEFFYGDVEDYTVSVVGGGAVTSIFSFLPKTAGVNENLTFTDASLGNVTTWEWNFGTDATPAAASTKGPHTVQYSSTGTKTVSLTVKDANNNENTFTKAFSVITGNAAYEIPQYFSGQANFNDIKLTWIAPGEKPELADVEGFEGNIFPPAGWGVQKSTTLGGTLTDAVNTWNITASATYVKSGAQAAYISYSAEDFNWLVTPDVEIAAAQELQFDLYYKSSSYATNFRVMVLADGTWNEELALIDATDNLYSNKVTIDLAAYAGKTIKIAFVQENTDGWQIALDNVDVTNSTKSNVVINALRKFNSNAQSIRLATKEDVKGNRRLEAQPALGITYNYANSLYSNTFKGEALTGFKIYKDGAVVANLDASAKEYQEKGLPLGSYSYTVSAVYGVGESYQTAPVVLTTESPEVLITSDKTTLGIGEDMVYSVETMGTINSFAWDFGADATPATASTEGPHTVTYSSLGEKTVTLTINGETVIEAQLVKIIPGSSAFKAPTDLTALANGADIKLDWLSINTEVKVSEDFEGTFPPTGWEIKSSTTLNGSLVEPEEDTWFQITPESFEGAGADYIHGGDGAAGLGYSAPDFNWLITNAFDVAAGDKLNFWLWYNNGEASGTYYWTNFRVMVYDGTTWKQELFYTGDEDPTGDSPSNNYESAVTVDLASYAGKNVKVAFVYEFTDGFELAIDDVSIMGTKKSATKDNTFAHYNIYRNNSVVATVTDADNATYTDVNLATGFYTYQVTAVYNTNDESFPTNEASAVAYQTTNLPYEHDFEANNSTWVETEGEYVWSIGETINFDNASYSFPTHSGTYVAVNTSEVPGSIFGYDEAFDLISPEPMNFADAGGQVSISFDYVSDISTFILAIRKSVSDEWAILKSLPASTTWTSAEVALPYEYKVNGAQIGFYFDNASEPSNGVAFDNVSVTSLEGKHIQVEFKGNVAKNNQTLHLGSIKPEDTRDYTLTVRNIGSEEVVLGEITLNGEKFALVTSPANTTLAVNGTANYVLKYTPLAEGDYTGSLVINSNAEETPYALNLTASAGITAWTYMVYLYEDGTGLDGADDINEMEANGSVEGEINYIVLYDADNDEQDGIYMIRKDANGYDDVIVSEVLSTHMNSGLNMDDWKTLEEFVVWTKENYPAEHYGLNVWDHGSGIFKKSDKKEILKGAVGEVKLWEMDKALKTFKDIDQQGLDILGFDVCLLGQIETAYQMKNLADYIVYSERTTPGDGWDYEAQFAVLNQNSAIEIEELANEFTNLFVQSYQNGSQGNQSVTQSAIRVKNFDSELVPAINNFADAMIENVHQYADQIMEVADATWSSDDETEHIDMGSFLTNLLAEDFTTEVDAKIQALLDAYNTIVVNSKHNNENGATGMKVWVVDNISTNSNGKYYTNSELYLNFCETKWDEFLLALENPVQPGTLEVDFEANNTNPFTNQIVTINNETAASPAADTYTWTITPTTYTLVEGTTLNSANIKVKFTATGNYTLKLDASRTSDSKTDSETKTDYIVVKDADFDAPFNLTADYNTATKTINLAWDDWTLGTKLSEGFEGETWPPAGWAVKYSATLAGTQTNPAAEAKTWFHEDGSGWQEPTTEYIHTGVYSAATGYNAPEFNWLITPEVAIEAGDKLSFWIWYNNGESSGTYYWTNFRVMVYDGTTWTQEIFYTGDANPVGDSPANNYESAVNVDLSSYAGKNVKVAFVYEYTDGWQLAVDDISIVSSSSKKTPAFLNMPNTVNENATRTVVTNNNTTELKGDGTFVGFVVYRNNQLLATINDMNTKTYQDNIGQLEPANFEYKVAAVWTNPDGMSDFSNVASFSTLGIETNQFAQISLYPNPNSGSFTINLGNLQDAQWTLYNANGQMLSTNKAESSKVSVDGLESGIYFVKVVNNNQNKTFKVVVQ